MPGMRMKQRDRIALLTPFQLGPFRLSHRIVMGPLTRCRSHGSIPQPHAILYYAQRTTKGGMILTEATSVNSTSDGYKSAPGIWTKNQVEAWKPIVNAVHKKGGIFFCQLSHVGRRSHTSFQPNGERPLSSTNKPSQSGKVLALDGSLQDYSTPRALGTHEIQWIIDDFVSAAKNAMEAGFDGVELHAANGYLIDQFLKDAINDRSDQYGGSLENRARFVLELIRAVADAVGRDRVGIKLSPFADFGDGTDSNPTTLGVYLAKELSKLEILYVTFVEARIQRDGLDESRRESVWPFRKAFKGVFFAGGGYSREEGIEAIESGKADAVIYAHLFLANPDLPRRFELDAPLNECNPTTFFTPDPVVGYTDYPMLHGSEARSTSLPLLISSSCSRSSSSDTSLEGKDLQRRLMCENIKGT